MSKSDFGDPAQDARLDFPLVIASMPASAEERKLALIIIVLLFIIFMVLTPFAGMPLARVNAFIPAIQTVLCVLELVTAILLFSQYSIQPQFGLLALASGYIFSGLFAFIQTLSFPEAYAPNGLIGDPLSSASYLFCLWYLAFPLAVIVYAASKDTGGGYLAGKSRRTASGVTIASALAITAVLTWAVTAGAKYLPSMFLDETRQAPITNYYTGSILLLSAAALLVLSIHKRTSLSVCLMVTVFATLPDLTLSTVMITVRFTLGWYTARTYALIASCIVLSALLTESALLYARVANAVLLLRRERSNRLMSLDAATSAREHELKQPLTAVAAFSAAASNWIKKTPPNVDKVQACLASISNSIDRANEVILGVRELFKKSEDHRTMIHIDDIARQVLQLMEQELRLNEVAVETEFQSDLPEVCADRTQIQQVILNLARNAIDAMGSTFPRARRLRLVTSFDGRSSVLLSIQDTGPGIATEQSERVFEPFFTTKSTGMGLGLSICQTIVHDHGGNLRLAKTDAHGSDFEMTLPIPKISHGA